MSKETAQRAIKAFKAEYAGTAGRLQRIREDRTYSDEYKQQMLTKEISRYNSVKDALREDAIREINELQAGIRTNRLQAIQKGLESAEQINLILQGINNNAYSHTMLQDIITSMQGNSVALESIRGSLLNSPDESTRLMAAEIPTDKSERVIGNLSKIANHLRDIPAVESTDINDFAGAMYRSGESFDSWCSYIDSIE